MNLTEPKRKKNWKSHEKLMKPLPIINESNRTKIIGNFNGFTVIISDSLKGEEIIRNGYFGKGNFSRTLPHFDKKTNIIRKRVAKRRQIWNDKGNQINKIIIVPDSSSSSSSSSSSENEEEEYFTNLKPEYQIDSSGIKENVQLMLEEAFFLQNALNCFEIYHNEKLLDSNELWDLFKQTDRYFPINYIGYFYFRTKNWVVKTGIKFGCDFLLYKEGPPFYHASYLVIVQVVDENLKTVPNHQRRSMNLIDLMGLNRLCETTGKELLICQIVWPFQSNFVFSYEDLNKFQINEILMTRWIPKEQRQLN